MFDFMTVAHECAPDVDPSTLSALVQTESSHNPYAIGVVGGHLERQPKDSGEAIATANILARDGWNFSLGAAQVNRYNLEKMGISFEKAFEPCTNIRAGAAILTDCYTKALPRFENSQQALKASFSCYYSGDFKTGFKPEPNGKPSYVQKVLSNAQTPKAIAVISDKPGKAPTVPKVITSPDDLPQELLAAAVKPKKSHVPVEFDGFDNVKDQNSKQFDGFSADVEKADEFNGYSTN